MKNSSFKIEISASIGIVSAELISPSDPIAVITLAHGAGAGMQHQFLKSISNELAEKSVATLRFNFPYMEQKKKRPDFPAVAHKAVEAALNEANKLFPDIPVFASGKSFGGRMSSQYLASANMDFVKGIIFFGFPLHPAAKPSTERAEHLKNLKVPMLFLQGTRDTLAEWNLIERVTQELPHATLIKFEGADHSFKKGKENLIPLLSQSVIDWINTK